MRRLALLVAALFALLGATWAVASPPGSSPDDNFHLASIWCAWGDRGELCTTVSTDPLVADVPQEIAYLNDCPSLEPSSRAACAADQSRRADWLNDGLYPPVYYATMGTMASGNVVASTVAMRLVNVLLAATLLGAALLVAPARLARAYLLAFVIGAVPLGLFLIASTNPSGWLIVGSAGLWVFTATWLVDHGSVRSRRTVTAIGLLGSAALMTARGDGAILSLVIIAAALVLHAPSRPLMARPRTWWPLAVVAGWSAITLLTSSQVAVHSSGMKGEGSPSSGYEALPPSPGFGGAQLLVNNVLDFPRLVAAALGWPDEGALGGLGWLDVRIPALTGFVMLVILGGAVLIGLSDIWPRKAIAAVLLLVPLVLLPLVVLQRGDHVVGYNVQGRYLLPPLVVLLAIWLTSRVGTPRWPTNRAVGRAFALGVWLALATATLALVSFYQWSPAAWLSDAVVLATSLLASAAFAWCVAAALGRLSHQAE